MSKLLVKTRKPYRHLILQELGDNPTAEDVLDHLFGNRDGWVNSDYTVREYVPVKSNLLQRVNVLWVYPLLLAVVCPVKWLLTGRYGFKTESSLYRGICFLLGDTAR